MIDDEINMIIHDVIYHSQEMLKFLKKLENGKYNPFLDDLINYALCTKEDMQAIEYYIIEIELKLYDLLNGGDANEKQS